MDPDYNPANDRQAFGRIYRLSQSRPVFIYRLLATGTLEEHKYVHQLGKEDMARCFKSEEESGFRAYYKQDDMLIYHDDTRSCISTLLDKIEIDSFNDEEIDSIFAEEIATSAKYRDVHEVPYLLAMVKDIFGFISYAFHSQRIPDKAEQLILEDYEGMPLRIRFF
ncbi:DNA repair and recombination protein RAD54 isoform X1 [Folsomia candida]|uniref:DNA repair and recombination protein RAD54 isoform X1 n=1 Tax=Folsomia candida TaxID=158441 RepID=UPI000B8F3FFD|nr:DNA repair and recombination protein RAD54 isoform X1 [Folsomia candida]